MPFTTCKKLLVVLTVSLFVFPPLVAMIEKHDESDFEYSCRVLISAVISVGTALSSAGMGYLAIVSAKSVAPIWGGFSCCLGALSCCGGGLFIGSFVDCFRKFGGRGHSLHNDNTVVKRVERLYLLRKPAGGANLCKAIRKCTQGEW